MKHTSSKHGSNLKLRLTLVSTAALISPTLFTSVALAAENSGAEVNPEYSAEFVTADLTDPAFSNYECSGSTWVDTWYDPNATADYADLAFLPCDLSPVATDGAVEVDVVPEKSLPEETTPTVPEETVPEETIPVDTKPDETVPDETVPDETVPDESTPVEYAPVDSAPVDSIPVDSAPVEPAEPENIPLEPANPPTESAIVTQPETPAAATEADSSAPLTTEPVPSEPVPSEPATTDPQSSESAATPATTETKALEPVAPNVFDERDLVSASNPVSPLLNPQNVPVQPRVQSLQEAAIATKAPESKAQTTASSDPALTIWTNSETDSLGTIKLIFGSTIATGIAVVAVMGALTMRGGKGL